MDDHRAGMLLAGTAIGTKPRAGEATQEGVKDKDEWIDYFCFELDFGKKWKEGVITEKDGTDIILKTPEDLYNLLEKQIN